VSALACAASGCVDFGTVALPVLAECEANVIGVGLVDTELDYLPRVVACENGAASLEALKAQAVSARSYLYYRMQLDGMIGDGQGDQVYTCANPPNADHLQAVAETEGEVVQYMGVQVAAFYVAGAFGEPPECFGGPEDPTDTEQWVTYNSGLSGDAIMQTPLGFVDPGNLANRGCMSQNGADCLSDQGVDYGDILRFYYGEDIEHIVAEGSCVDGRDDPDPEPDPGDLDGGCGCQSSKGSGSTALLLAAAGLLAIRRRRG
jgi:MYXO-CTERM domain-containing protein